MKNRSQCDTITVFKDFEFCSVKIGAKLFRNVSEKRARNSGFKLKEAGLAWTAEKNILKIGITIQQ